MSAPSHLVGTSLVEDLVQSVAYSHLVAGRDRVGLLLLAAPESGKTTIACAATAKHVKRIVVITARSVMAEMQNTETEYLLFNDMAVIRALSKSTSALLINTLNQLAQGEKGEAAFAGQQSFKIDRPLGIIGCLPYSVFSDRRAHWKQVGFISRMLPFAYSYSAELIATIKNGIDLDRWRKPEPRTLPIPKRGLTPMHVRATSAQAKIIRALADAKATQLDQLGIRILKHYHTLVRAHAIRHNRIVVDRTDLDFLRAVDSYISITECKPL